MRVKEDTIRSHHWTKERNIWRQRPATSRLLLLVLFFTALISADESFATVPVLIKDINSETGSASAFLTDLNGTLLFQANDGENGAELWRSDNTEAGTELVMDIMPGSSSSEPANLIAINNTLFFTADDGINGVELWKSDGTEGGTKLVKDIQAGIDSSTPTNLTNVNGTLYFTADDGDSGIELWKSDSTEAGTVLVKDIYTGEIGSSPAYLTRVNRWLFFTADDGTGGVELWKSDGTANTTIRVRDIHSGSGDSTPEFLTDVNGTLYFSAINNSFTGVELWKSDGTESGTVLVRNINRGAESSSPANLINFYGTLYFTADDGSGVELWKSDGTIEGTIMVANIAEGAGGVGSSPDNLTDVNGILFFRADDGINGVQLWKSNGLPGGTVQVVDLSTGMVVNSPANLTNVSGILYFTANDGSNGEELWQSDGTSSGTVLVQDINPAAQVGSSPSHLTLSGTTLYFSADDGTVGNELWSTAPDNTPPTISTIADYDTYDANPITAAFTVADLETAVDELEITATSDNADLLTDDSIIITGEGGSMTIQITPSDGNFGTAGITLNVSDGTLTSSTSFMVEWWAAHVVANEPGPAVDYTTIFGAIDNAADGDLIIVKNGVYTGVGMNTGLVLDDIKNLVIRSENGPEQTIIDMQGDGRAFDILYGNTSVIDGFTFMKGDSDLGGAIFVDSNGSSPHINNCIFLDNYAIEKGGAIYIELNSLTDAYPRVTNSIFSGNSSDFTGGGIHLEASGLGGYSAFEISTSSFSKNSSRYGGAVTINKAGNFDSYRKSIIRNSKFFQNRAQGAGAIAGLDSYTDVVSCAFTKNSASLGGALATSEGGGGLVANSTFWKNSASDSGGAVYIASHALTSTFSQCTFARNDAREEGGGIRSYSDVVLDNSIVWNNSAGKNGSQLYVDYNAPITLTVNHSNIEGSLDDTHGPGNANVTMSSGGGNLSEDPKFALLEDFHLMPDSPCIDAGSNSALPADTTDLDNDGDSVESLPLDLDGRNRLLDGTGEVPLNVDMGAFEYDRTLFPVAGVSPERFFFTTRQDDALPEVQMLYVRSRGIGDLNWELSTEIPWLRFDLTSGTSAGEPGTIRLYVDQTGLTHGIHTGTLDVIDQADGSVYRTLEVTLYVTTEIHVPSQYGTIQSAIDAAIHGDEVIVADGVYVSWDLDFLGKRIMVRSANGPEFTTIDTELSGRVFRFHRGETAASVLQGFTIFQGVTEGTDVHGGGILIEANSSPTILDCIFMDNWALSGGGLYVEGSNVNISNCRFISNTASGAGAEGYGGAVAIADNADHIIIDNCFFDGNSAGTFGGAILSKGEFLTVNNSEFINNTATTYGGGVNSEGESLTISGCLFSQNNAGLISDYSGGGVYLTNSSANLFNNVFEKNDALYGGGMASHASSVDISNCTFYKNDAISEDGAGIYVFEGTARISNSNIYANNIFDSDVHFINTTTSSISNSNTDFISGSGGSWTEKNMIHADPLYIDPENGDFRLDPESPCIDAGVVIPWLFSDIRGSVRPVDGDADGKADFDIGAYEYSDYYGGLPGDLTAKAFMDFGVNGSEVAVGFETLIKWKDRDPFPFDPRIGQADQYEVNLALVNEFGLRVDLGTFPVEYTQQGYSIPYAFSADHIGTWRLRLEMTSDPNQFVLSDEIVIKYKEATRYVLSQWIQAPEGADPSLKPDVDDPDACYWSVQTSRLYGIAPTTTVITWYADESHEVSIPVVAYIDYPDKEIYPADPETQIHVADSMPVNLIPPESRFDLAQKMYASNDANIQSNQFTAAIEGWSVIKYYDHQAIDDNEIEKFDVVRTYAWDHDQDINLLFHATLNPDFPFEQVWDIGTEVTEEDHNPACNNGYVFFENSYYDGAGENKAYNRETRQGPIFVVNENDPNLVEDDLVVVWYKTSAISGVCWPSKPVRYDTLWPEDAPKIVIASRLGSGPLDPDKYGQMENLIIYNQPDPDLPGTNPNEEHSAFFTAQGSAFPAIFPLRTDLNRTDWNVVRLPFTSKPYALLKYRDPLDNRWNFEVYQVLAQSGSYRLQTGQVIPDSPGGEQYYIDANGSLVLRSGYLPEVSYYINSNGRLVNPGDTFETCYNLSSGVIGPVQCSPAEGVLTHYFDTTGQLQAIAADAPPSTYFLDEHGVLVESDVYFRFHYSGVAGQEINPPYPLNQLTFGPCVESYIKPGDEVSVLKDKDNKFFAKHGGINDEPTVNITLKYFYRMQEGFYLDQNSDGFQDAVTGTPIPWLEGLDGTFDGVSPVDTTFAISWPDPVPTLFVGETLLDAKTQSGETVGLPNVADQCVVQILFDQALSEKGGPIDPGQTALASGKLIDPLAEHSAILELPNTDPESDLPQFLKPEFDLNTNRWIFSALPYHLQARLTYDAVDERLKLKGLYQTGTGEPLLLLNTLSERDIMEIGRPFLPDPNTLDPETWDVTVIQPNDFRYKLYGLKTLGDTGLWGVSELKFAEIKALTAGNASGPRLETGYSGRTGYYVTLAFNNDANDCPGPVTLSVIKVDNPLYRGQIKVIESTDVFEEKVTLRHNGDFGGNPDSRWFQWKYLPADFSGIPYGPDNVGENWQDYFAVTQWPGTTSQPLETLDPTINPDLDPTGIVYQGADDMIVQGTGQQLLPDKWFSVRYYYDDIGSELSRWTEPQLYEGWIKRVMKKINLFDQKVKDFHTSEVNTLASMISLAGTRYEGAIALSGDPENLNKLGIIEVYNTLFDRGKGLTIDQQLDLQDSNKAILFAANRLADLYMMVGNDAYGDAKDPTIGFSTEDGQVGNEAASIFSFQNQVDSLLEEELVLLRGRDAEGVRPFYNRLIWNFTLGNGELAYKENYNITDLNEDGETNERDAMIQFPQGHGDAWGHYLSASKYYYNLLKHQYFTWIPQTEAILVEQTPVEVDYRDERKFAAAAAAKGRTGAEIVNLTYRQNYVEDPEGQWQGYKDPDPVRAWGLDGWSRRAGQGAYFDWVVGNAILPPDSDGSVPAVEQIFAAQGEVRFVLSSLLYRPGVNYLEVLVDNSPQIFAVDYDLSSEPVTFQTVVTFREGLNSGELVEFKLFKLVEGIQKVDRQTVLELGEIASQYNLVQAEVDKANVGLNPLGLAKDVVPFDIDPARVANGQTHFEQIYDRAVAAMNNAIAVFNHANQSTNLLRRQQDTLEDFKRNIDNSEADFNNRLIEVFGYPYGDDCGPGQTYETEYCQIGPDLFHYMYVEPSELMGVEAPKTHEFPINFKLIEVDASGALQDQQLSVLFHVDTDSRFGLIKPDSWQSNRKASGEIQFTRSDLLRTRGRFDKTIKEYEHLLSQIERQADLLETQHNVNQQEIKILYGQLSQHNSLNTAIKSSRLTMQDFITVGKSAYQIANAIAEGIPSNIGVIGGTSNGTISDILAPLRSAEKSIGVIINETMSLLADSESGVQQDNFTAKEIVSAETNLKLTELHSDFAAQQQLLQLENLIRGEVTLRHEIYLLVETMQQAAARYMAALAKGERLLQDRLRFRKQTAAQIQDYRYSDMAFRIFRNDALQKYQAQFDLAAMYVYLAAKAYDYDTTLLDSDTMAGQQFLTDIVRQRTIGLVENGLPLTGSGLADPMKRMWQNFQVIKPQLGFNNPQIETNRFSLRQELFRIKLDEGSGETWRQALESLRVTDLWDVPEFRRYCRPFAAEGIPEPGIVIPFSTTVTSRLNFFRWPLGGGDSSYSSANFATKVRSVGTWFSNYNSTGLSQTPRVYLVPVGEDILRTPAYYTDEIRSWRVVDQKLPLPFPLNITEVANNQNWIPSVDTIFEDMFDIRRFSDFRAYHDSGYLNQSEMQYDSRLIGRSVWNNKWLLIIPGSTLLYDPDEGLDTFIHGPQVFGGLPGERTGNGILDIKLFFETYSYSGN